MECSKQKQLFQIRIIRNSTFLDVSLCKYELLLADYMGYVGWKSVIAFISYKSVLRSYLPKIVINIVYTSTLRHNIA